MDKKDLKVIKTIIPASCPECNKKLFLGYQMMIPTLTAISTEKQMQDAKNEVKTKLGEIKFKDEKTKTQMIEWLNNEKTLIDQTDVEDVLKQVVAAQSPEEKE